MTDANVQPLFGNQPQPPEEDRKVQPGYLQAVNAALDIAGARVLALLAVIGGISMFLYAVYDPLPWRTYTVAAYSAVVLWPVIWLSWKKG